MSYRRDCNENKIDSGCSPFLIDIVEWRKDEN